MKALSFFRLNVWAFVLDAVGFFLGGVCLLSLPYALPLWTRWATLVLAVVAFSQGLRLHAHYRDRCRLRDTLVARNRRAYRTDTFKEFMVAPCGRMVVLDALDQLGLRDRYQEVSRAYPFLSRHEWAPKGGLEIIPYKSEEDL